MEDQKNKKIVWIASYPKSGSTWTRIFLDTYIIGDVDLNDIATSISDIRRTNLTEDVLGNDISEQLPYRFETLEHYINVHESAELGFPLFIKTHSGNYILNEHKTIPPELTKTVICLVRDPKDVLPSFAKHMGRPIETALKDMKKANMCLNDPGVLHTYLSSWNIHVESYLDADDIDVCLVRYEDMLANPVKEFTRILIASGIEPDIERVKEAVKLTDIKRLQKLEQREGFKEASKHQGKGFFGKEKPKLSLQQLNKVTKAFHKIIRRLGYFKDRAAA